MNQDVQDSGIDPVLERHTGKMMSRDINKVMISGRLGRNPQPTYLDSGNLVSTFSVASNRRWRDRSGVMHDEVEWFQVVTWNQLATFCTEHLHKGTRIYVEGRMQTRTWLDETTGQQRSRTELRANDIVLLDLPPCKSSDDDLSESDAT